MKQLALPIALARHSQLAHFVAGGNQATLDAIHRLVAGVQPDQIHLSGASETGKTHLLQAACRACRERGGSASYLPLSEHQELHPDMLQGMQHSNLVALDDVPAIADLRAWELAVFNLYNALRANGGALLTAARCGPAQLALALPDLRSRLGAGATFSLEPLDDAGLTQVLRQHAEAMGINDLPDDLIEYLLRREQRSARHLVNRLHELERESLARGRRLNLSFARGLLRQTAP